MSQFSILDELYATIMSRKLSDPNISYVAKLYKKGRKKIAQKVGEEAVELALESVGKDRQAMMEESADLIFHLLVLWADCNIEPNDVLKILQKRKNISGIEEKQNRK